MGRVAFKIPEATKLTKRSNDMADWSFHGNNMQASEEKVNDMQASDEKVNKRVCQ